MFRSLNISVNFDSKNTCKKYFASKSLSNKVKSLEKLYWYAVTAYLRIVHPWYWVTKNMNLLRFDDILSQIPWVSCDTDLTDLLYSAAYKTECNTELIGSTQLYIATAWSPSPVYVPFFYILFNSVLFTIQHMSHTPSSLLFSSICA